MQLSPPSSPSPTNRASRRPAEVGHRQGHRQPRHHPAGRAAGRRAGRTAPRAPSPCRPPASPSTTRRARCHGAEPGRAEPPRRAAVPVRRAAHHRAQDLAIGGRPTSVPVPAPLPRGPRRSARHQPPRRFGRRRFRSRDSRRHEDEGFDPHRASASAPAASPSPRALLRRGRGRPNGSATPTTTGCCTRCARRRARAAARHARLLHLRRLPGDAAPSPRAGAGIGMTPAFISAPTSARACSNTLEPGEPASLRATLYLLYPSSGQVPRKVTAFRDFFVESMAKAPFA